MEGSEVTCPACQTCFKLNWIPVPGSIVPVPKNLPVVVPPIVPQVLLAPAQSKASAMPTVTKCQPVAVTATVTADAATTSDSSESAAGPGPGPADCNSETGSMAVDNPKLNEPGPDSGEPGEIKDGGPDTECTTVVTIRPAVPEPGALTKVKTVTSSVRRPLPTGASGGSTKRVCPWHDEDDWDKDRPMPVSKPKAPRTTQPPVWIQPREPAEPPPPHLMQLQQQQVYYTHK
jgi:hypothetical protein